MPRAYLDDLLTADRVLLDGVTGSGKSTAALRLGEALGLPVHLVDEEIGWLPGWVQRHPAEQYRIAEELAGRERWVFDSTYSTFRDAVLPRVDVVIGLDYPRWFSLARLVRRTALRVVDRSEICNGNVESPRQVFSRDSILVWHFKSYGRKHARILEWEAQPGGPRVIRLTHPGQLDRLLAAIAARTPRP